MDTRKAHTVSYNELFHHLWDTLVPSVHTLLCNPVGPRQFCALPHESPTLWQHQQLNVSVRHTSSVVDMLGAQVTTCQHLSCHCWKPCTVSACFHGITHTPYTSPTGSAFSLVQHTSHKNQNTLQYFKICHGYSRPSLFNDIFMVSTDSCTMTQSTYADYMLKTAVPWYCFMPDILLPHFFCNFLVYLSEVETSKYGTRNTSTTGSTTGMNKDTPLIPNNNHAVGVEK